MPQCQVVPVEGSCVGVAARSYTPQPQPKFSAADLAQPSFGVMVLCGEVCRSIQAARDSTKDLTEAGGSVGTQRAEKALFSATILSLAR
jgi:hypothetical protein